ncbi:MAG TPA: L,D-transpeptidase family protein [Flavobacterium sp.]|uniref:L,D-transpeptidase family protein n=1 Tax=Flavobacterium sp. TaxID=239 RepID=UPI002C2C3294|nr:L,D-transpeptidase family protein [Flavobacterium sp.]HSD15193.1 L,D-transpeptidase family protein [Flavobacterium sp.]
MNCKKEVALAKNNQQTPPKVIPINAPNSIAFDSTLLWDKSGQIKEFYRNNLFKTVWTENEDRKALIALIKESEEEGLNPGDYNFNSLEKQDNTKTKLSPIEIVNFDILLTESFHKFANHLYNGKLNPKQLYGNWDTGNKKIKAIDLLQEAIRHHEIYKTLDTLKPNHLAYHLLKKSLKKINEMPEDHFDSIRIIDKINPNESKPAIKAIKKRLAYWGDFTNEDSSYTNNYDNKTIEAVKRFQKRHGLLADGVIGKNTVIAMNASKEQRKNQIIANLERWRWFPRHLGKDYIIINIPEFKLYAIKGNDTARVHKVVVGKDKRQTPVLSSHLSNLVINPTWTVPPTIIKEDLGPTASQNRGYFAATRITIYDSNGQEVAPSHWNAAKPNNYRYVQKPGENNSLGLVKFNFPNGHLVYLHDTNHKELFELTGRSLSSGCVRVENPLDLAYYLLETDENVMNQKRVKKIIASGKTSGIPLKKHILIHLLYWTTWINEDGFQFRPDIYNLDADLYQKLRD